MIYIYIYSLYWTTNLSNNHHLNPSNDNNFSIDNNYNLLEKQKKTKTHLLDHHQDHQLKSCINPR